MLNKLFKTVENKYCNKSEYWEYQDRGRNLWTLELMSKTRKKWNTLITWQIIAGVWKNSKLG